MTQLEKMIVYRYAFRHNANEVKDIREVLVILVHKNQIPVAHIAQDYGVSRKTIYNLLTKHNIPTGAIYE